jgi:hypothetical protein
MRHGRSRAGPNFSRRLSLALRCGDNLFALSSFPVHADEKINLKRDAQVSLQGAMDGGGFKKSTVVGRTGL